MICNADTDLGSGPYSMRRCRFRGESRRELIIDPIWRHEKCASRWPAHFGIPEKLFLGGRRLGGRGSFDTGEDGAVGAGEENRGPGSKPGEQVGCATGAERRLRTLTAEGSGEVGGFALLEENDADDEERNDDVNDYEKNDHGAACNLLGVRRENRRKCADWCGGGDLNPYALRR